MRLILTLLVLTTALHAQPKRIVSTAPSVTETLFALGLGDRVVGVSTYCHYPAQATKLPRVGTYMTPNLETIARLRPDLVILQKLPKSSARRLTDLGLQVLEVDSGDMNQNLENILTIGKATQTKPKAENLVAGIRHRLATLQQNAAGRKPRSVVFIVGRTPGKLEGLVVVGAGSYLSELLTAAGGANIFADSPRGYLKTSLEVIVRRNPDVIIDMGDMAETTGATEAHKQGVVALWSSQPTLKAIATHTIFAVASDIFVVPGPRMLDAAQAFAAMLGQTPDQTP